MLDAASKVKEHTLPHHQPIKRRAKDMEVIWGMITPLKHKAADDVFHELDVIVRKPLLTVLRVKRALGFDTFAPFTICDVLNEMALCPSFHFRSRAVDILQKRRVHVCLSTGSQKELQPVGNSDTIQGDATCQLSSCGCRITCTPGCFRQQS